MIVIGLRALRELARALQDELDENRKPLNKLFENFQPILQDLMNYICAKVDSQC